MRERPSTQWHFCSLLGFSIKIFETEYTIGKKIELPQYIVNNKAIIGLATNDDNLCFFRALAIHHRIKENPKWKIDERRILKATKALLKMFSDEDIKQFGGVSIADMDKLEEINKINIMIYELNDNDTVSVIRNTINRYEDTLYLNLYLNHFSYIKNIKLYSSKYQCENCSKIYKSLNSLNNHKRNCNEHVKMELPKNSYYQLKSTIFEELEKDKYNKVIVPEQLRYYKSVIVYDFESLMAKPEIENTEKVIFNKWHVPISVSINSNVPGYDKPKCIINENMNTQEFIENMVNYMKEIQEANYENIKKIYSKFHIKNKKFDKYIKQIPVISFN
jgi:hypothetical protein